MKILDCLLAATLAILLPTLACGQDAPDAASDAAAPAEGADAPDAAATEAPAADAAATEAKFNEVFGRWKELLKQIRTLQVKYQSADEAGRTELAKQFGQLVGEARGLVPDVVSAAEDSYRAAPGASKEVTNFLGSVLTDYLVNDNYEPALPLAELLIEGSSDLPKLYMVAGTAAFVTHNYDKARTYLQKARENGDLEPPAGGGNQVEQRIVQLAAMYAESIDRYDELWKAEQKIRAAEAKADDLPRVKLETNKGTVVVELFENEAPQAVANFVTLIEEGYYDDLSFHRVIGGFMAQGGCPQGDGTGGPGYHIACECHGKDYRRHFRGTLSMAHAGRDTGGSQFFLTFVPTSHLDAKHTAFGRVIEGMDVLAKLNRSEPATGLPPDKIVKATVVRKREHPYEFKKLPATR